jgi:hypothetical protein
MPLKTDSPSDHEHLSELAGLLALALSRMSAVKSSKKLEKAGEISLDSSLPQSGHPNPSRRRR